MADESAKAAEVPDTTEEIPMADEGKQAVDTAKLTAQVMRNPEVLAALQDQLNGIVGHSSGYIQNLPKAVKRRLKALKKLQNETVKIESKFYEEVHELECKYAALYVQHFDKRREVVTGTIEPTDSDCDWPSDEEDDEEADLADQLQSKAKLDSVNETKPAEEEKAEEKKPEEEEETKGVPQFWLTIFKNVDMLNEMVQDHDEPILKHLTDIRVIFSKEPMGFTLEFHFEANEYFKNTVLTKWYEMRASPDEEDPFSFEGPEIVSCKGCTIDWQPSKNVTVKTVKKTQKHKGRGTKRTVTKQVKNDSFFNFFDPPAPSTEEGDEDDDESDALLSADYEIGHFIRERVVPRAVLYFTGEALDEDDDYEGEEEDEDEEGEDDEDADFQPPQDGKPAECKQQ